jgi:hypothetical protein
MTDRGKFRVTDLFCPKLSHLYLYLQYKFSLSAFGAINDRQNFLSLSNDTPAQGPEHTPQNSPTNVLRAKNGRGPGGTLVIPLHVLLLWHWTAQMSFFVHLITNTSLYIVSGNDWGKTFYMNEPTSDSQNTVFLLTRLIVALLQNSFLKR